MGGNVLVNINIVHQRKLMNYPPPYTPKYKKEKREDKEKYPMVYLSYVKENMIEHTEKDMRNLRNTVRWVETHRTGVSETQIQYVIL